MNKIADWFKPDTRREDFGDPTPEEIKTAEDHKENRTQKSLDKYTELDDEAKEFFRTWEPPIKIEKVGNKTFVRFGDQEFIAEYCTDIRVTSIGDPPHTSHSIAYQYSHMYVYAASNAHIEATMASGRTVTFSINRHALEVTYAALQAAHREAVS